MKRSKTSPQTAALLFCVTFFVHARSDALAAAVNPPNVVLISIDTLRADRIGCYGDHEAATPAIDRLAASGSLFEHAYAQIPMTRPSHASIMTGLYPFEHLVRDNFSLPLAVTIPTLASVLKSAGYTTAGFPASVLLSSQSGLQSGFDFYLDNFSPGRQSNPEFFSSFQKNAETMADAAIDWLDRNRSQPFFLFLHFYDPHSEYNPPEPYRTRFASRPYDGEVAYTDAHLARFLEALHRLGHSQDTLIVLCSDHGEGLGEHGEEEHLFFLYNSTLHVPLILSWPGRIPSGKRVTARARTIDIMPTVLALAGVRSPDHLDGIDLSATLRGQPPAAAPPSYAETLFPKLHFGWSDLRAVTDDRWKLIRAPRPELYDIENDPSETRNLFTRFPQEAARLAKSLDSIYLAKDSSATSPESASTDASTLEALASLGYVGGSTTNVDNSAADPKDKIAEFQGFNRQLRTAITAFSGGDYAKSAEMLQDLIRRGKSSFEVQYFLGRALMKQGKLDDAIARLKEGISKLPAFAPIYTELARAYIAAGRLVDAIALMQECLRRDSENATFHAYMGYLNRLSGDLSAARREYERARDIVPADTDTREALASVYRDSGRIGDAERELREVIRTAPDTDSAWNALGMILAAAGKGDEAEKSFREAIRYKPDDAYYHFNLALLLDRKGDSVGARGEYEEALRLKADFAEARQKLASLAPPAAPAVRFRLIRTKQKAVAETILRRIAAGEQFDALARSYSVDPSRINGGLFELSDPGKLKPEIAAALQALQPNETSQIVRDGPYFLILRLLDRR